MPLVINSLQVTLVLKLQFDRKGYVFTNIPRVIYSSHGSEPIDAAVDRCVEAH